MNEVSKNSILNFCRCKECTEIKGSPFAMSFQKNASKDDVKKIVRECGKSGWTIDSSRIDRKLLTKPWFKQHVQDCKYGEELTQWIAIESL